MTDAERRRESRAAFTAEWIAALHKPGPHFCLPTDLEPGVRDRIAALERNARSGGFAFVAGAVSLTELRTCIRWWADAIVDASKSLEREVLQ